jgi:hypothetical protein
MSGSIQRRHSVPLRNSNRRAFEDLEGSVGYVSSGEGQWSRTASRGGHVDTSRKQERQELSRLDMQISKETSELFRHERRAREATDPSEVAKHIARALKTRKFFDRLRREQRSQA